MELRKAVPLIGLGALLILDAVLIFWAFRPTPAPEVEPSPAVSVSASDAASPSASPSESPSQSEAPSALEPAPLTRFVAPVSDSAAWVVDSGTCDEVGAVWSTDDSGDTWSVQDGPGLVSRARPESADTGFVTGGGDGCELTLWGTGDGGASWGDPASAANAWSRVPDDATTVHIPSDEVVAPCPDEADVVDFSIVSGDRADALCADGTARRTTDGGDTWSTVFTDEAGLSMTVLADGSGVLLRADDGCDGVVAVPLTDGEPDGDGSCVEGDAEAGKNSVAGSGEAWWLVLGDEVFRASETGGPWEPTGAALSG